MAYITKEDIELWFNNEVTLSDTLANQLIEKNSRYVDFLAGTKFEPTTVENEEYDYEIVSNRLYLKNAPIIQVLGVWYNKGDEYNPDWEEIEEWFLDNKDIGLVVLNAHIPAKRRVIKASYIYGYETVPFVVKQLVTDLCVLDVLKIMTNKKSYNDEGDIDLGTLRISNSFKYSLSKIQQLKEEIEQLKNELFGFKSQA